jgi:ABC-2 type transport system permease protein
MIPRLLTPWKYTASNRLFADSRAILRTLIIISLGIAVCLIIYLGTYKVLSYFHAQDELGIILSLKIFQMIWILLFAMLIFSAMITAVSTLYLSEDNEILLAAPLPPREIFQMRFFTTSITTSWMVVIFSLPVFGAYDRVFQAGLFFWPLVLFSVPAVALIGSSFAILLIILVVYLFPAKRTKDIVLYLSLCFGLFLYLVFRLMRPEDLVNPDQYGQFIEYFSAISAPAGPWLPAGWAANLLSEYLLERHVDWLLIGLLLTTPMVLYFLGEVAMDRLFITGFSKSQESFGGHRDFRPVRYFHSRLSWFFRKELRQFTRDSGEWSQFFMLGALIIVYLYNFKVLPLDRSPLPTIYISNLIAFGNIALAGFLAASLATRFVYPSIGAEKGAFYLIGSSPLSLGKFLWYKYLFYLGPFTLLALILVVASNHLLQITGPMWWISLYTTLVITWTVLAMGLGFGALFRDFKSENRAAAMGPGAILFLFCALFYELLVIALGFFPTYRIVRGSIKAWPISFVDLMSLVAWLGGITLSSFLIGLLICRAGVKKLQE